MASEPVKVFLAVAGSMAAQGPVIFWVANHRLHHAFADTDRDPHSPQPQGPGSWGRVKGLWHGHVGWLFTVNKIDWSRHTRDWLQDRRVMKINGHYFSVVLPGIVIPGVVGGLATQSVHGFVGGILWGGFARIFALDHATWVVNSLGHTIGNREFHIRDESRNIGVLAPPTMGGSWHNNHHARPSLAQTRRHWWQLDLVGDFIRLLDRIGLVQQRSVPQFIVDMQGVNHDSSKQVVQQPLRLHREESLARAIVQLNPKSARAKRVVALVTIGIPAIGFADRRVPGRYRQRPLRWTTSSSRCST